MAYFMQKLVTKWPLSFKAPNKQNASISTCTAHPLLKARRCQAWMAGRSSNRRTALPDRSFWGHGGRLEGS